MRVIGSAQVNFFGVNHKEYLPGLAVSRDAPVERASVLVGEPTMVNLTGTRYNHVIYSQVSLWVGKMVI